MEISTPLSVKFEKNNATKFLQVNTLNCQIWKKKTPPKFCKLTPLSVKFEKKKTPPR